MLQKKLRYTVESAEAAAKKAADEANSLKQQMSTLRDANAVTQEQLRSAKRRVETVMSRPQSVHCSENTELFEKHNKVSDLLVSVETRSLAEQSKLEAQLAERSSQIAELKEELVAATQTRPATATAMAPEQCNTSVLNDAVRSRPLAVSCPVYPISHCRRCSKTSRT